MAKKSGGQAPLQLAGTAALLQKQFGTNVLVSGTDFADKPDEMLSVSPRIDAALGGGLLVGSLVTISGPSGCGKTTHVLDMAASWQQQFPHGSVWYANAEHKVLTRDVRGIKNLDFDRIQFIQSSEDKILTAQDYLLAVETVLHNERYAFVIIDSFSILSTEAEMTNANYEGIPPGGSGRLVGNFCRRMAPVIPINNNMVVGIAQVYAAIGGQGNQKWATSLPNKAKYARSTGLKCTHTEAINAGSGDDARQTGQRCHWVVERSALGPPGAKFASRIRYGAGIDKVGELIEVGSSLSLIQKSGAWYSIEHEGETIKSQGEEKFYQALSERPDVLAGLTARLAECLKCE